MKFLNLQCLCYVAFPEHYKFLSDGINSVFLWQEDKKTISLIFKKSTELQRLLHKWEEVAECMRRKMAFDKHYFNKMLVT